MKSPITNERLELILNSRDEITKGRRVPIDHATDLVLWYGYELDRMREHYQASLRDIGLELAGMSVKACQASLYPED